MKGSYKKVKANLEKGLQKQLNKHLICNMVCKVLCQVLGDTLQLDGSQVLGDHGSSEGLDRENTGITGYNPKSPAFKIAPTDRDGIMGGKG